MILGLLLIFNEDGLSTQEMQSCKSLPVGSNEIPPDGIYCIDIAYAEWDGKSLGTLLMVEVKGDYVKIIYRGGTELSHTKPGDVIEEGLLLKHKSGVWIISSNANDKELNEVGGCSDGPTVIDFKEKKWWTC